ncbi:unnamed protein product [Angiostrongylus costaricensis]|uniref:N-acetyltransferase domain-containing protein n=1 Tax=Angiostrongylus costaricensis TaxID=334426 RepID=A0A0R3PAB2_ANGCS|nr:unnamed protein product [Angiostrongylus costaricensis]
MSQYSLTPLVDRQDLSVECINLLNQEWPRSYTAREHSQAKSSRSTPPMSFLLIQNDTDKLIGHARLCLIPNRPNSCWIESVIVTKDCRGVGLGKLLMASLEDAAKSFGFKEVYLCTKNEVIFYERCGYEKCDPILHSTTATSAFPAIVAIQESKSNEEGLGTSAIPLQNGVVQRKTPDSEMSPLLPVPPPPPLDLKKSLSKPLSTSDHQCMWKKLD